ncbi:DUF3016 domain-containing protein [Aromatoleum toluclasticum]|uniref:DUF3016 domain-containing protein n=1 Tax=Aromatoleum toluclasticum TaxID=92003 RepID=UPI00036702DE|nr:DUF3016 domain-containing protein [Aromatoleum toluclasticum]MCC4118420.1 DUF3016 domain-containing protein [Aromatoleum toluclasticum]
MRARTAAALITLAAAFSTPVAAEITVSFVGPQTYTDAGGYGPDAERNLRILDRHITTQGARCIAKNALLRIDILDVDLAGQNEWWHAGAYDLRVMRDITWPRLDLAYRWQDMSGNVLAEGREKVSDMNYLWHSAYVRNDSDGLPYEKLMLRDWFERRFCRAAAPG